MCFRVSQVCLSCLQLVQNTAARLLTQSHRREHITPVLAALHWLPVCYRIDFKIILFVFKLLNDLAPPYLSVFLHLHSPSRSIMSADQLFLAVPKTRLKTHLFLLFFVCELLWFFFFFYQYFISVSLIYLFFLLIYSSLVNHCCF